MMTLSEGWEGDNMKYWQKIVMLIILIGTMVGCVTNNMSAENHTKVEETTTMEEETPQDDTAIVASVTIRSIGDILIHDTVYYDAATETGYDFNHMFIPVKEYMENADITTANMEVIVAGTDYGISTYPLFNSPHEIIEALQNAGVDIINNLTNHSLDYGAIGAHASIENIQSYGMEYVGSYQSWEDYNQPRIIEVKDMKIGFLSYAYGANGNHIPEEEGYLFTLIDTELMKEEIKSLNEQVDVSIVMIHNGEEYEYLPVENQLYIAEVARDAGATFVLGGHPHIVQPFIRYNEHQGAWFSHGNFLSGQYQEETRVGGIGEYTFHKLANGEVIIGDIRFMPTYTIGMPETSIYYVVPLVEADEYGFYNGEAWFEELTDRLAYFTNVEVVDYLD